MNYEFKWLPELIFALIVGSVIFIFKLFVAFEPEAISDWGTWAIIAGGGLTRAIGGAGLAFLASRGLTGS